MLLAFHLLSLMVDVEIKMVLLIEVFFLEESRWGWFSVLYPTAKD